MRNSDTLSKKIALEFERNGQNVRKYYQRRLPSNPTKDYYYLIRNTPNNETIIIEYGFVDSNGDDVDLLKNNWQDLAEAVVKAVTDYAGGVYMPEDANSTYIVKSGDSLWSIAKKYNTSIDKLKNINGLSSNLLKVGQVIELPVEKEIISSEEYIVKPGDTLYSISNNNNISLEDLKTLNNLSSNTLYVGQVLRLKKVESKNYYIVKPGDTLYQISKQNNIGINELKAINNLKNDTLYIGQKLVIPDNKVYTVESGDTIFKDNAFFNKIIYYNF